MSARQGLLSPPSLAGPNTSVSSSPHFTLSWPALNIRTTDGGRRAVLGAVLCAQVLLLCRTQKLCNRGDRRSEVCKPWKQAVWSVQQDAAPPLPSALSYSHFIYSAPAPPPSPLPLPALPLAQFQPHTSLFPEHIRYITTSGPSRSLFPLPGISLTTLFKVQTVSLFQLSHCLLQLSVLIIIKV